MKAVKTHTNTFERKGALKRMPRNHDFEDADLPWLLKWAVAFKIEDSVPYFETLVWPEHGKPIDSNLTVRFVSDKTGLKSAREYVKKLIEAGAVLASVRMRAVFVHPSKGFGDHLLYDEDWEPQPQT